MRHTVKLYSSGKKQISTVRILQPFFILFREFNFMVFLELSNLFFSCSFKKNHFALFIQLINDSF